MKKIVRKLRQNYLTILFWSMPFGLLILQWILMVHSNGQIREEEVGEIFRQPWWFQNRSIINGTANDFGVHFILTVSYNLFGFHLFIAKYYKLLLFLVSMLSVAALLKNYFGVKKSFVPLLAIGLSPTLLFFNTLTVQPGVDLMYFPICLWILLRIDFKNRVRSFLLDVALCWVMLIAWLSYPTFVYYLPVLAIIYLIKLYKAVRQSNWWLFVSHATSCLLAFILPIIGLIVYLQTNREMLWSDPYTKTGGLFRGGGQFLIQWEVFSYTLRSILTDLFVKADSYYFEVNRVEFSDYYPIISVVTVMCFGTWALFKKSKFRVTIILAWILVLLTIFIGNFAYDLTGLPGLRRATPLLAAFYVLFSITWYQLTSSKNVSFGLRLTGMAILLLIPIHHLVVYPTNLAHISDPSEFQDVWLNSHGTPEQSLKYYIDVAKKQDVKVACAPYANDYCPYSLIYSIVSGYCYWNKLECHPVYGYNPQTRKEILLERYLWETRYFDSPY